MRKLFPGHYRPTNQELDYMWRECVFAFDANVLLNVYRYTRKTQERLLEILGRLQDRIWVPHQAAHEYHKNRLTVISDQMKVYDDLDRVFQNLLQDLKSRPRHPFIDYSRLINIFQAALTQAQKVLKETKKQHPNLVPSDPLSEKIATLFEDRVGSEYPPERYKEICTEAEERIKQKIPPGYKDSKKDDPFGDILLWYQLIAHAEDQKKPIIFVTDDVKEDWWLQHEGQTIGPRPELIKEMFTKAGVSFYMYRTERFMIYAQNFLDLRDQPAAVEEVREISKQDAEKQQRQLQEFGGHSLFTSYLIKSLLEKKIDDSLPPGLDKWKRHLYLPNLYTADLAQHPDLIANVFQLWLDQAKDPQEFADRVATIRRWLDTPESVELSQESKQIFERMLYQAISRRFNLTRMNRDSIRELKQDLHQQTLERPQSGTLSDEQPADEQRAPKTNESEDKETK
jgi:hypothetical protein